MGGRRREGELKRSIPRWSWIVAAVAWTVASVAFLWMPPPDHPPSVPIPDKLIHFVLFFGIGLAWHRGVGRPWYVLAAVVVLGALTEIVQGMLPWPRSPDAADLVADAVGAGVAIFASVRLSPKSSTAAR